MTAFAGNSLLCRLALKQTSIDAASFTFIRIISGAVALWLIVNMRKGTRRKAGSWPSALALFTYAATFSFAYTSLSAGTGALLLFGAVQATMIISGLPENGGTTPLATERWSCVCIRRTCGALVSGPLGATRRRFDIDVGRWYLPGASIRCAGKLPATLSAQPRAIFCVLCHWLRC